MTTRKNNVATENNEQSGELLESRMSSILNEFGTKSHVFANTTNLHGQRHSLSPNNDFKKHSQDSAYNTETEVIGSADLLPGKQRRLFTM